MKNIAYLLLIFVLFSCETDTDNRNPFLLETGFRFDVNRNLPLYNNLNSIGNPVFIPNDGVGLRGVFVINSGFDTFRAFEATCPNHVPNECSTMILDGQNAVCACEGYTYSLFTGQQLDRPDNGERFFDMLEYRTAVTGATIIISN